MPKIKTHSGLKKRLKRTGSGKLKRSHATFHTYHTIKLINKRNT